MPNNGFNSLSEAIQNYIDNNINELEVSPASPLAAQFGQNQPDSLPREDPPANVLRWGFSTWGIEPVTGAVAPLAIPVPEF